MLRNHSSPKFESTGPYTKKVDKLSAGGIEWRYWHGPMKFSLHQPQYTGRFWSKTHNVWGDWRAAFRRFVLTISIVPRTASQVSSQNTRLCMKPRRPPMTNAHALLDGTETAFRQACASERPFACIFKKKTSLGVKGQMMQSPACTDPKRSLLRGQSLRRNYTGGFGSWPPAICRFSTRRSFDHHGKGNGKEEFRKKKLKLVRISHWADSAESANDCEIACDCVKRATSWS